MPGVSVAFKLRLSSSSASSRLKKTRSEQTFIAREVSDLVGAHSAVVGALGSGESILGPAEGVTILVQQRVLLSNVITLCLWTQVSHLLNSKPGLGRLGALHHLVAGLPLVGLGGLLVVFVGLAHHQDVVTAAERIRVDLDKRITNNVLNRQGK